MTDLKHFGNRRPLPWSSIVKVMIVVAVMIWMGERDRQHIIEKNALADAVHYQAHVIDAMECGIPKMISPIGRVES